MAVIGYVSQRKEVTDISGALTPIAFSIPSFDTIFTTKAIDCSQDAKTLWYDGGVCWQNPPYSPQGELTGGAVLGPFMTETEQRCEKQIRLFESTGEMFGFIGMQAKTYELYIYAIFSLAAAWACLYLLASVALYVMKFIYPESVRKFGFGIVMEPSWMCREAFMKLDTDGDGMITVKEVSALWESYGLSLSAKELADLFQASDQNHDGTIGYSEFKQAWTYSDAWRQARRLAAEKREQDESVNASAMTELNVDDLTPVVDFITNDGDQHASNLASTTGIELSTLSSGGPYASTLKGEVEKTDADSGARSGSGSGAGFDSASKLEEFKKQENEMQDEEDEEDEDEDEDLNSLQFTDSSDVVGGASTGWSLDTEQKFAPVSTWGAQKRFATVLTARFGRHLGPRVMLLAYFTLRFGWDCSALWYQVGAAAVMFFLGFVWWTFLYRQLRYQTGMVQQGEGHKITKNTLSATSHFAGGVLRLDQGAAMYWPLLQHSGEVAVGIVMLEFASDLAAAIIFSIYLALFTCFWCLWPYEDTGGGFDVNNWGSVLKQILLMLALLCLVVDQYSGTCSFDSFGTAYKMLGLIAAIVPPVVSKCIAYCTVKSLNFEQDYVSDQLEGTGLEIVELGNTASFIDRQEFIQGEV